MRQTSSHGRVTRVTEPRLPKRERTRRALLKAAVGVIAARGVESASIQEIAAMAGVANGTFYLHFRDKAAVVEGVASWISLSLCERIAASQAGIKDGAERMAIGNRRYVLLAIENPGWALLFLDVAAAAPDRLAEVSRYPLADLDLGRRQGRFAVRDRQSALDLVMGTVAQAMRTAALARVPSAYPSLIAGLVLRGLGMAAADADEAARRPLPDLPPDEMPLPPLSRK
jgi:AcrR family transcriptional regulator